MDAGTTSAYYRNRKRPLDGRPCNPKVKRCLFPADVLPCPNRRAAETKRSLLKRQRRVVAQADGLVGAAAETICLLVDMGWYSYRELGPLYWSIKSLVSDAMRACNAAGDPVEVSPDLYEYGDDSTSGDDDSTSYDDDDSTSYYDDSASGSSPPAFVESGGRGAGLVTVTHGDETIRGKRQAKANSKYYGPEWSKK